MTLKVKRKEQLVLTGDAVVLYTCPADTEAQIIQAGAHNIDATDTTDFSVKVNTALYISNEDILPKESSLCDILIGMVLEATDTITPFAGAIADINFTISVEETALLE